MYKVHPVNSDFQENLSDHLIDNSPFQYDDEEAKSESTGPGYVLPTGMELMSGPIKSGGMSRTEKEIDWVISNVKNKLNVLRMDQNFQTSKLWLFFFALVCAMVGLVLIFFGLRMTILFDNFKEKSPDYIAVGFGGVFCIPMLYFFSYLFFPNKVQKTERKKIRRERKERRKPTLFNQMVEDAKKATEPPPRLIKVIARFRKKDYEIVGSTWKDFCEEFERVTGLPIERQLIRFKEEDLVIDLTKKMDKDYGLDNFSRVFIYNKGGLFTRDAPLRRQYEDILSNEHQKMEEIKKRQKEYDDFEKQQRFVDLIKKVSGNSETPKRSRSPNTQSRGGGSRGSMRASTSMDFSGSGELATRTSTAGMSFSHKKAQSVRFSLDENNDNYSGEFSS